MRKSPAPSVRLLLVLAILCGGGPGCAPVALRMEQPPVGGPQSECDPAFPDQDGWYGADAAYSVPLPAGDGRRSAWLFGDTFVRRPEGGDGRTYPFIHNSVGVSICEPGGRFRLDPFWRIDDSGVPHAFFEPDPEADWARRAREATPEAVHPFYYWPLDGIVVRGVLYVALLRVAEAEPNGPFNLPFRLVGVDLARIPNPADPPPAWRIGLRPLVDSGSVFPGAAFVLGPGHLYAFAFVDEGESGSPRILTRLPLRALEAWSADLPDAVETLGTDGRWRAGLRVGEAAILMDDAASEMSVHFDPAAGRWLAVYSDLGRRPAGSELAVRIRRAPTLRGPWSPPASLVTIPETRPDHAGHDDPNLFCYAGKAHPQFSTPDDLAVTYVCNLYARDPARVWTVLERLRESPDLYRPRLLRVPSGAAGATPAERADPADRRPGSPR